MPSNPSYKCALITGSFSGLGKGLADFLEAKGIEVIRTGSRDIDLSHPEERKKLLATISQKSPDLIVNNAGMGFYGPCLNLTIDEQLKMIELNCKALVEITLHAAFVLKQSDKQGTILNISSAAGFIPFPTFNVYSASKAFVTNFSLGLDSELKNEGIRVLCACPGPIATNFRTRAAKGHPQITDELTMTIETAALHLWKQLVQKRPLYIFDWRTRLVIFIARMTPRFFLNKILKKQLKSRY